MDRDFGFISYDQSFGDEFEEHCKYIYDLSCPCVYGSCDTGTA